MAAAVPAAAAGTDTKAAEARRRGPAPATHWLPGGRRRSGAEKRALLRPRWAGPTPALRWPAFSPWCCSVKLPEPCARQPSRWPAFSPWQSHWPGEEHASWQQDLLGWPGSSRPRPPGSTWQPSCCTPPLPSRRFLRQTRPYPGRSLPSSWGQDRQRKRSRQWGLSGPGLATHWLPGGRHRPGAEDPPSSAQDVPAQPPPCAVRWEL